MISEQSIAYRYEGNEKIISESKGVNLIGQKQDRAEWIKNIIEEGIKRAAKIEKIRSRREKRSQKSGVDQ